MTNRILEATRKIFWIVPLSTLALGACHEAAPEPAPAPMPSSAATAAQRLPPGHPAVSGTMAAAPAAMEPGLPMKWKDPPGWISQPPSSSMRMAQFQIPKAPGDPEPAELAVFYFGAGQGGDIDSNVNRWLSQFKDAEGAPARAAKNEKRVVGTLPVTIVSAEGTYDGGMAMTPDGAQAQPKSGWALLGAIAQSSKGPWFFKMTGPKATIEAARPGFDAFVSSLHSE